MEYVVNPVGTENLTHDPQQALQMLQEVHNFGMSVQAALGPKTLSGRGLQGRVLIAFAIGSDGALMGARITRSSGHHQLDSEALKIVGNAVFPAPPSNFGTARRTYVSAFTFT